MDGAPSERTVAESAVPSLESAGCPEAVKKAILSYLRSHRDWYSKWSNRYAVTWHVLTFLVIVLGALASILTATGKVDEWVLIALPAISSLCAAILVQFRLRETCRLRDEGRIATERLICDALRLRTDLDLEEARDKAVALRERAHRIEFEQLNRFMAEPRAPDRSDAADEVAGQKSDAGNGGSDRSPT